MNRHLLFVTASLLLICGCAAVPRKMTLTDVKSGEVCNGSFNLVTRDGWVVLPDGTRLTGKIVGTTNARTTTTKYSGDANLYGPKTQSYGTYEGSSTSFSPATQGEG